MANLFHAVNKRIGCTPFEKRSLETEKKNNFLIVKSKTDLIPTKVVVGNTSDGNYTEGDTVWVKGDCLKHPWSGEVFEVNGVSFVLMPVEFVALHQKA